MWRTVTYYFINMVFQVLVSPFSHHLPPVCCTIGTQHYPTPGPRIEFKFGELVTENFLLPALKIRGSNSARWILLDRTRCHYRNEVAL